MSDSIRLLQGVLQQSTEQSNPPTSLVKKLKNYCLDANRGPEAVLNVSFFCINLILCSSYMVEQLMIAETPANICRTFGRSLRNFFADAMTKTNHWATWNETLFRQTKFGKCLNCANFEPLVSDLQLRLSAFCQIHHVFEIKKLSRFVTCLD